RLLAALTTPLTPLVPLPKVTAPTFATAPLSQCRLTTTKLPLVSAITPSKSGEPSPMVSRGLDPSNVLMSSPVAPLNRYTAPASVPPASSYGDVITTLPVLKGSTVCPKRLPGAGCGSMNSENEVLRTVRSSRTSSCGRKRRGRLRFDSDSGILMAGPFQGNG